MKNASAKLARTFRLQATSATSPISFVDSLMRRIEQNVQLHPDGFVETPFTASCLLDLGHRIIAVPWA